MDDWVRRHPFWSLWLAFCTLLAFKHGIGYAVVIFVVIGAFVWWLSALMGEPNEQ